MLIILSWVFQALNETRKRRWDQITQGSELKERCYDHPMLVKEMQPGAERHWRDRNNKRLPCYSSSNDVGDPEMQAEVESQLGGSESRVMQSLSRPIEKLLPAAGYRVQTAKVLSRLAQETERRS